MGLVISLSDHRVAALGTSTRFSGLSLLIWLWLWLLFSRQIKGLSEELLFIIFDRQCCVIDTEKVVKFVFALKVECQADERVDEVYKCLHRLARRDEPANHANLLISEVCLIYFFEKRLNY